MKFLCMTCDAQMNVVDNERQKGEGTMAIVLECPECFGKIGMMTNPMETKMLDALDVSVCPVGGRNRAAERAAAEATASSAASHASVTPGTGKSGSGCPMSGLPRADKNAAPLEWTDEARQRLANLPSFVRSAVEASIESFAREKGRDVVDAQVMADARTAMGM